jgi:hypothetical protein
MPLELIDDSVLGNYRRQNGRWRRFFPLATHTLRQEAYRRLTPTKKRREVATVLLAGVPSFWVAGRYAYLPGSRREWLEGR